MIQLVGMVGVVAEIWYLKVKIDSDRWHRYQKVG